MKKITFRNWMEFADYGFDRKNAVKGGTQIPDDAGPVNPIDCAVIMSELKKMPPLGIWPARWSWQDIMEWGRDVGAIKIDISPLGSYKIIARRKIKDLQGENTWVCKKVIPLYENEHNDNEIPLAHDIYEHLEKISDENLDSPARSYPEFEKLVHSMRNSVTRDYPNYCMFPVFTKKMSEDYFKFVFEFKGHGVESPTRSRAEQFNIDLLWERTKGLIRCWGYDISSDIGQHNWQPRPSEWDEYFAPTQPIDEIVDAVATAFSTY